MEGSQLKQHQKWPVVFAHSCSIFLPEDPLFCEIWGHERHGKLEGESYLRFASPKHAIIDYDQGLINYIVDTKAKCRHLKQLICKGTLRQVFICLRSPPLLGPHSPRPLHTLYVYCTCILIHTGSKIPLWLNISPVYKTLIYTCRNVPLQVIFYMTIFALVSFFIVN